MAEIEDRRSVGEAAIVSEGLRVGFRVNREYLISHLSSVFVPGSAPIGFRNLDFIYSLRETGRESYSASFRSRVLIRDASLTAALDSIASDVQQTIAGHSREHLYVHAGVIGWRGRAILFPGNTCSGKSTLIRALIRAGAVYFSDEFARIDGEGLVHPCLRPLTCRTAQGKSILDPEKEALKIASGPSPIGAIVATKFVAGGTWRPVRLSPGQAALEVLNNTVAVRLDPAKAVRYVGKLVSSACAITSPRGEAEVTVRLLLKTLDKFLD